MNQDSPQQRSCPYGQLSPSVLLHKEPIIGSFSGQPGSEITTSRIKINIDKLVYFLKYVSQTSICA